MEGNNKLIRFLTMVSMRFKKRSADVEKFIKIDIVNCLIP